MSQSSSHAGSVALGAADPGVEGDDDSAGVGEPPDDVGEGDCCVAEEGGADEGSLISIVDRVVQAAVRLIDNAARATAAVRGAVTAARPRAARRGSPRRPG